LDKNPSLGSGIIIERRTEFRKINRMEPAWLHKLRKESWVFYQDSPLPDLSTNVWRYTDPNIFILDKPENYFDILPLLHTDSMQEKQTLESSQAAFGFNDGKRKVVTHLSRELEHSGVIFKDLYSAIRDNQDIAQRYFGQLVGSNFGKFEALNLALWNVGMFLCIPKNLTIEKPIYLHRHPTDAITFQRLLVIIGENTQATIIDDYSPGPNPAGDLSNNIVEIFADDSANVRYVNIQRLGSKAKTYLTSRAQIEQNTNMNSIFGSVGSGLTKANIGTVLNGRGGNSRMYGIVFGNGKQQFDYHTAQYHKASESYSNLNFKVALKEKARSVYTGLIRIEKETANCQAYQENRNLLLNLGTKADSIPELEILTDQVICTHGATMGPIDPEMVFYLKSRGISEDEAVKIIVAGFVEPMIHEMPQEIGSMMRNLVQEKLSGG
jgi:Fe-S cluster assembly protein SufD